MAIIFLPPDEPIRGNDNANDGIDCTHVVHIPGCHGPGVRETVHHEREERPAEDNAVGHESDLAEPERAMADVVSALQQQTRNRHSVAEVEEHNGRRDHAVERCVASEVEDSNDSI